MGWRRHCACRLALTHVVSLKIIIISVVAGCVSDATRNTAQKTAHDSSWEADSFQISTGVTF